MLARTRGFAPKAAMRVMVQDDTGTGRRIAIALARSGCSIVETGACDLIVTVSTDPALPGTIRWRGSRVRLTRTEQALFARLRGATDPVSRQALLSAVWGYSFDPGTNLLAVHISRLRAKLGAGSIVHEGGGYRLHDGSAARPADACNPALG